MSLLLLLNPFHNLLSGFKMAELICSNLCNSRLCTINLCSNNPRSNNSLPNFLGKIQNLHSEVLVRLHLHPHRQNKTTRKQTPHNTTSSECLSNSNNNSRQVLNFPECKANKTRQLRTGFLETATICRSRSSNLSKCISRHSRSSSNNNLTFSASLPNRKRRARARTSLQRAIHLISFNAERILCLINFKVAKQGTTISALNSCLRASSTR
mmetsp:Transcript_21901/g.35140  ORF Transcript_21901/g.35140 Transcript_21901/m.35140 type:complete len:211 (-) Transcript_21901:1170-1802(-)